MRRLLQFIAVSSICGMVMSLPSRAISSVFIEICNTGNTRLSVTYAELKGGGGLLVEERYELSGWHPLEPGRCGGIGDGWSSPRFIGFAQRDGSGRLGIVKYEPRGFPYGTPNVESTRRAFCVNPKETFTLRGTRDELQRCPQGFTLAEFSLYTYPVDGSNVRLDIPADSSAKLTLLAPGEASKGKEAITSTERDSRGFKRPKLMSSLQTGHLSQASQEDSDLMVYAHGITKGIKEFVYANERNQQSSCARLGDRYYEASSLIEKRVERYLASLQGGLFSPLVPTPGGVMTESKIITKELANARALFQDGIADIKMLISEQSGRCDTPIMKAVTNNLWGLVAEKSSGPTTAEDKRAGSCEYYKNELRRVEQALRGYEGLNLQRRSVLKSQHESISAEVGKYCG